MSRVHDYALTLFETISTKGYANAATGTVVGNLSSNTNTIIDRLVKKADGKWYSLYENGEVGLNGVFSEELYSIRYVVHNPNYLAGVDLGPEEIEEVEEEDEDLEYVVVFEPEDGPSTVAWYDNLDDAGNAINVVATVYPDTIYTLTVVVATNEEDN